MQPSAQSTHWCSILGYALRPQVLYLCSSQEPRSLAHTWCHTCGQPSGEQAWMTHNSTGTVSGLVPPPRQLRKAWRTRLSRRWADGGPTPIKLISESHAQNWQMSPDSWQNEWCLLSVSIMYEAQAASVG